MRAAVLSLLLITFCACEDGGPPDGTGGGGGVPGPDMAFLSACGHPGDEGNNKGVGKFCMMDDECPSGLLCSTINNDSVPDEQKTFFCVKPFCATTWSAEDLHDYCGDDATCLRNELGAACAPNECAPK